MNVKRARFVLAVMVLLSSSTVLSQSVLEPKFEKIATLEPAEWRFRPLLVDLFKDGHVDLVATARLVANSLHIWSGNQGATFKLIEPSWSDVGYGALATGDINHDGFPDIVVASHFGKVQTLLSDGKGGFVDKVMSTADGYVAAQLADINGDGNLDLILLGYSKAGIEVYFGDGKGNWVLHKSLPEPSLGPSAPGRDLVLGDVNGDGHQDIVAAFQRWGVYVYYGDGQGGFSGGPVDSIASPTETFQSLALTDVNHDGHLDLIINGIVFWNQPNGPDVYLGDGHGHWKASSSGLKVLKTPSAGLAVGDVDNDGNPDIIAAGSLTGDRDNGWGLFLFKGDGKGNWELVKDSGLPTTGLASISSVTLADLDHDGSASIIVLSGTSAENGSIGIWRPIKHSALKSPSEDSLIASKLHFRLQNRYAVHF